MKYKYLVFLLCFFEVLFSRRYFISASDTIHGFRDLRIIDINNFISDSAKIGDSLLFKCGERFYGKINILKKSQNNLYLGSYVDKSIDNPIIDGSIYHFEFNADFWNEFVIINGTKFYKKSVKELKKVENAYLDGQILTLAREPDENETVIFGKKNSYTGFFQIDSVDSKQPRKIFYDFSNKIDWTGGSVVTKTSNFTAEVKDIISCKNGYELSDNVISLIKKNGYFIQDHYKALDSGNEWFFDKVEKIFYFSTNKQKAVVSLTGIQSEDEKGIINIDGKSNIKIENLILENGFTAIQLRNAKNITIKNNQMRNSNIGIDYFSYFTSNNSNITENRITDMRSFGIHGSGNGNLITMNEINNIGMTYGCNAGGVYNLEGITIVGDRNEIINNKLSNIGYSGIKIYQGGSCKIIGNTIDNFGLRLSDTGGIYSWHCFEGNKLIKGNIISNGKGNKDGTSDPSIYHANGIYLDELSLHFRLEDNYVFNCGNGIYFQNSRNDTIIGNKCQNNYQAQLYMNSGGTVLNGGSLNPSNDIDFDPDTLKNYDKKVYFWDKKEGLLYKNTKDNTIFVDPVNILIKDNQFVPDDSTYTFIFRTWRGVDDNTLGTLTSNSNFIYNNLPKGTDISRVSLLISSSHVWDRFNSNKVFQVGKIKIDKSKFTGLKEFITEIFIGTKYKN